MPTLPTGSTKKAKFIVEPTPYWHDAVPALPASATAVPTPTPAQLSELSARAAELLSQDAATYQTSAASTGNSASDTHFLQTILTKGTLSDRLSALTLLVQSSPVHNGKALETLKSMAERGRGRGGRDEGLKAVRCVVDWWVGGGAPSRKLKYFRDQPLLNPSVTDQHLVLWYFEDWLKKYFFSILQTLETYSLDPLSYVRTQSLAFISTLLRDKPEQEQNLLRLLVNKLGDTEKTICSRASYHLLQILQAHPAMKSVIVREIKSLIFRPTASTSAVAQAGAVSSAEKTHTHIRFDDADIKPKSNGKAATVKPRPMERWNTHAWYYAAVTLNQVVLTPSEADRAVARTLIGVYFEMFEEILGANRKSASHDSVAKGQESDEEDAADGSGKNGKVGRAKGKGRANEVKGAAGFAEVEDATSRLVGAILTGINRALPFAKVDMAGGDDVFNKHIDTLFLITHTSTFNISLQALVLILQIISSLSAIKASASSSAFVTGLTDRFYRTLYASLTDQRLASSNKQAMYLNLLFKALKADVNLERVKAFVRRFLQVLAVGIGGGGGTEFVAGGLYLLGELFSSLPSLKTMLRGMPLKHNEEGAEEYDSRKRDPQYAHASATPMYELLPLLNHYHPTIALHARQLLSSTPMTATPDLSLNTLSHFLDRFVYKNPKKLKSKGSSAMQPAASKADGAIGVKLFKGEVADMDVPINDEQFWKQSVDRIPVDQLFFHKYFIRKSEKEKAKSAKAQKRKGKGDDSDEEDSADESDASMPEKPDVAGSDASEGEEESDVEEDDIWKAMKATMPAELQDDDLMEDDDDLPSDFDVDSDVSDAEKPDADEASSAEEFDGEPDAEEEDADDFSLVEGSDAEDLLPLDAEVPMGLIAYDGSDAGSGSEDEGEWGGIADAMSKKRKRNSDDRQRKKKLRSLPTFASYEDYAKMIEDTPEDNI
ncbi:CBF-domain-containing protein [Obba rivulosa]|uniref:CBF-domain-containing protein n=1 Tax=Obba rivulosa TaxID=1052685 RepID=A0A8E2DH41_9APHY|nr:CBF-domain-containing protein [Obba rivulosa]